MSLAGAEDLALEVERIAAPPPTGVLRDRREEVIQDRAAKRDAVLRRLRWRGNWTERAMARSLEWPVGAGAVLRELAADGLAVEQRGRWWLRADADPSPFPTTTEAAVPRAQSPEKLRVRSYVEQNPGTVVLDSEPAELLARMNAARIQAGMSWRAIAEEIGVAPSGLTRWGQGRLPSARTLVAAARWVARRAP